MNWKDYPHLFANGKFKVMLSWDDISPFKILGYSSENNGFLLKGDRLFYEAIKECTLIARKIEDMADEEKHHLLFSGWGNPPKEYTTELDMIIPLLKATYKNPNGNTHTTRCYLSKSMRAKDLLYLLSIGVYPFDQSHFETGEVLDAKEDV